MKLSKSSQIIYKLAHFRSLMGAGLTVTDAERFFGGDLVELFKQDLSKLDQKSPLLSETLENPSVKSKFSHAQKISSKLQILGLVKFIAVTGSVAAGTAKPDHDIDLFIVVRDHASWIFRILLSIKLFRKLLHVKDTVKVDKLCPNFIVEERGVSFETQDIFVAHEILYMKPILNPDYYQTILNKNRWLETDYQITFHNENPNQSKSARFSPLALIFIPINLIAMTAQVGFMLVTFHNPNLRRIWKNYLKGRIAFYPEGFKEKSLSEFEKSIEI